MPVVLWRLGLPPRLGWLLPVLLFPLFRRLQGAPAVALAMTATLLPMHPGWRTIREDGSTYPPEDYPALRTIRSREPLRDAIMGIEQGSQPVRWIRINTQPILAGEPPVLTAVVATFTDVTDFIKSASVLRPSPTSAFRSILMDSRTRL